MHSIIIGLNFGVLINRRKAQKRITMRLNQILSFTSGRLYSLNDESFQDVLSPVAHHIIKQKYPDVKPETITTLGIMNAKELYNKEPQLLQFAPHIQEMIGWWRHDTNWKERLIALDEIHGDIEPL